MWCNTIWAQRAACLFYSAKSSAGPYPSYQQKIAPLIRVFEHRWFMTTSRVQGQLRSAWWCGSRPSLNWSCLLYRYMQSFSLSWPSWGTSSCGKRPGKRKEHNRLWTELATITFQASSTVSVQRASCAAFRRPSYSRSYGDRITAKQADGTRLRYSLRHVAGNVEEIDYTIVDSAALLTETVWRDWLYRWPTHGRTTSHVVQDRH